MVIIPEDHVSMVNELNQSLIARGQNASEFNFVYIDATSNQFTDLIESYGIDIAKDLPAELFLNYNGRPRHLLVRNVKTVQ